MAGNQYKADPRQADFLKYYLDRDSETFSNAYKSALKAGYEDEYAKVVTSKMPDWLSEKVKDEHLINLAENNLQEFLGSTSKETDDKKIKADMTKFTLKGLKKDKYSEKIEKNVEVTLPKPLLDHVRDNDSNKEDKEPEEQNTSSAGRY